MGEYIYESNGKPLINDKNEIVLARENIVRCRECIRFIPQGMYSFDNGKVNNCSCHIIRGFLLQINPDGFCAWGERIGE